MTTTARDLIADELARARRGWAKNPTLAHGLAILKEEIDEFWDLVKVNQNRHDYPEMILELTQVAAMAHRAWEDACGEALPTIRSGFVTPHDTAWALQSMVWRLLEMGEDEDIQQALANIVADCEAAIDALREAVRDE